MAWPWPTSSSTSTEHEAECVEDTSQHLGPFIPEAWYEPNVILPALALTSIFLFTYHTYARRLRRYPTIDHLPPAIYEAKNKRKLLGYVTSVGDGDNFRFFHTPGGRLAGWGWLRKIPSDKKGLKGETIHVRIAGVDAPELAHFGKPAQPYGQEALDWLRNYLLGQRVRVRVHSRDRFDRVVANPEVRKWPLFWRTRDVGVEQIRVGLATVFRQGGAEYGGLKNVMEQCELQARTAKKGMWARGKALETPAEYKRRFSGDEPLTKHQESTDKSPKLLKQPKTRSRVLSWVRWAVGR